MDPKLANIYQAILEGDMAGATEYVQGALDADIDAVAILHGGLIPAMEEVGRLFEEGEYFVPEMLISARAMQACLGILKPLLVDADVKPVGKVAIGTVKGDLHDIGKNLVAMMLEGGGFEITDLGTDVSPEKYIEAIQMEEVDIVGMSALLTTTMPNMGTTINAISEAGLREKVKIIIGGAPVTADYADQIGADGFAPDASQAVSLAKKLVS
ncbi:MAG: corrinoid protein [Anaerolineales bacterium]|nr:corrinoid protein [Anaerolineales bacterium]